MAESTCVMDCCMAINLSLCDKARNFDDLAWRWGIAFRLRFGSWKGDARLGIPGGPRSK